MSDFEPIGGYPPIEPLKEEIKKENFVMRSFPITTNIVKIGDIVKEKKKDLFLAFGEGDKEDGTNLFTDAMLEKKPFKYDSIEFDDNKTKNKVKK